MLLLGGLAAGCAAPGTMAHGGLATDLLSDLPPPATPMPDGSPASQPLGFLPFCIRTPDQCPRRLEAADRIKLSPANWLMLERVNADVNAEITPEADIDHYGVQEYWAITTDGYGNCKHYALMKRKRLAAAGLPFEALRIGIVRLWDGEYHAVLTVATDRGDYVLDNLRNEIRPWSSTGYAWIERQSGTQPWAWVALNGDSGTFRVAANPSQPVLTASTDAPVEQRVAASAP